MRPAAIASSEVPPIGQFLRFAGLVSSEHVVEAVRMQRETGEKLGAALVRQGAIDLPESRNQAMAGPLAAARRHAGGLKIPMKFSHLLCFCQRTGDKTRAPDAISPA